MDFCLLGFSPSAFKGRNNKDLMFHLGKIMKREILQLETLGVTARKWAPSSCRGMSNPKLKKERLSLRFELLVFTLQLTVQLLGSRKQGGNGVEADCSCPEPPFRQAGGEKTSTSPGWPYSPPAAALGASALVETCSSDTFKQGGLWVHIDSWQKCG